MAVPRQEVVTLPLPQALRQKLLRAGVSTMAELKLDRLREVSEGSTHWPTVITCNAQSRRTSS